MTGIYSISIFDSHAHLSTTFHLRIGSSNSNYPLLLLIRLILPTECTKYIIFYIYRKCTHAQVEACTRASGRKFRSTRTLDAAVKPVKGFPPFSLAFTTHTHPQCFARISVYARRRDARGRTKVRRRRRGRKQETRTAIVVEETFAIIRKLAFFLLFPFYEALRKYFVLFTQRITKRRPPPPINIIFSIPLLPACFEILRAEFRWSR